MLDRGDVNDDAGASLDHRWQQRAVEANGRHEIEVELLRPYLIIEDSEAAAGRGRTAEHVDKDVDPTEPVDDRLSDGRFGGIDILVNVLGGQGCRSHRTGRRPP